MIQDFYNKLSEKEKKVFYFAVGAIVLALFDLLFLRPVLSKLKTLDEEIFETENSVKRDSRFLAYRDRILAEREAFRSFYSAEIQTPEQIKAAFLQKIVTLAEESKINLAKLAPSGENAKKGFIKYYADLECTGSLEDLIKFMHKVDGTDDLLKVVKVNFTGKAAAKDVSASMSVVKVILDPEAIAAEDELVEKVTGAGASDTSDGGEAGSANAAGGGSGGEGSSGLPIKGGQKEVGRSQRVKVSGIEALWNKFWGIKPKPPKPMTAQEIANQGEPPEEKKPNLFQKILYKDMKKLELEEVLEE